MCPNDVKVVIIFWWLSRLILFQFFKHLSDEFTGMDEIQEVLNTEWEKEGDDYAIPSLE